MAAILIVDDERIAREILRRSLSAAGYEPIVAKSGREGIETFFKTRPDLVLLDLMMPDLDGFAVLKEIRSVDRFVPVIFLTGAGSTEAEIHGIGLGADDYISKTSTEARILARIKRALERNELNSVAASSSPSPTVLPVGEARVDFASLSIKFTDGAAERLTGAEAIILRVLAADRSNFHSTKELLKALHSEYGNTGDISTLRSQISRLKTKLGAYGGLLACERNKGYRLNAEMDENDLR